MLRALDLALLRLLRTRGHHPRVEPLVVRFSKLGEHGILWLVLAALLSAIRREREPLEAGVRGVLSSYLVCQLVKFSVRRARPLLEDLPAVVPTLSARSYPSCHAATSFGAARALGATPPLEALAAAMALSRPYLGVHWPSDSLAGMVLGDAVARLATR